MPIRLNIYEDNSSLRESLRTVIESDPEFMVCGDFPNALHAEEQTESMKPDIIIMDIGLPGINGIESLKRIRRSDEKVIVLMFTVFDDDRNIFEALSAGANGYILKKTAPEKILHAIRDAYSGGAPMSPFIAKQVIGYFRNRSKSTGAEYNLTAKEVEVLNLLVNGYSYKMIAEDRFISLDTVRSHIKNIYEKLRVNSKAQAVAKALREKLT